MVKNNLKKYVDEFFDGLELYEDYVNGHNYKDVLTAVINEFINYESDFAAFEVYTYFLMIYQITSEGKSDSDIIYEPNPPLELVNVMRNYDQTTGNLIGSKKNHLIHSVNVFLLGLAVYSQNEHYKIAFRRYIEDSEYEKFYKTADKQFSDEEFLYRWGIAALFHDVCYPLEIMAKQLNKSINDSLKSISNTYDVKVGIDFVNFDELNYIVPLKSDFGDEYLKLHSNSKNIDALKPTDIMAHRIAHNFDFDEKQCMNLLEHLNSFILYMREDNFVDSGFFSAILVLQTYAKLIQKYDKNYDFFFYPIVDSATAILLNNYYNKTLQEEPFSLKQLNMESFPIAYLLILCDELQNWNSHPFGDVKNQDPRVNDLNIAINNDNMEVEYILNNGQRGFGFNKEKKGFLYDVLDIEGTFSKGLSMTIFEPDFKKETMLNTDMSDINAQNLSLEIIEGMAIELNMQYNKDVNRNREMNGENEFVDERGRELFEKLPSDFKLSNVHQVMEIPEKLAIIGCEIATNNDKRETITEFSDSEIEHMAIHKHQEWCREKLNAGWTYGETRDDSKLIHNCLVPWDELDEYIKESDRDPIRNIPYLLDSIGLKVVRSKIRLLTFEMHKYHLKEIGTRRIMVGEEEKKVNKCDSEELFDILPDYVQYSKCKQTDFIVKILNEHKYELADIDDERDEINVFSDAELECFAECLHEHCYRFRVNLGWIYGEKGEKTSPNLVPWNKLDGKIKKYNKRTFENLPNMCNEPSIQLKIVRSE